MNSRAPIQYTCPDIDSVIRNINDAIKSMEGAIKHLDRDNIQDAKSEIDYAISTLSDYQGNYRNPLEDLRNSNSALRGWGEGLAEEVSRLEDMIEGLELIKK